MYIGFGWRVQGNEKAAKNLADFLINCDLNRIKPIEPIQLPENDSIILKHEEAHLPSKHSKSWGFGDNFYCHSLSSKEKDRAKKDKKMFVVSVLKKLDNEGIVLPYFDRLHEVPGIISDRVNYINYNRKYPKLKLSEILKKSDDLASEELFSENLTKFNIPYYTTKAVSLVQKFAQQGPEVVYSGEYFFDRGSVSLQNISIETKKEIRLKKEAIEKCPLKVKDVETSIENGGVLNPREMKLIDNAGNGFTVKKTESLSSSGLLINKDYTTEYANGVIYSPKHTEDLATLETLADWLLENNVPKEEAKEKAQEETKLEGKAETTAQPTRENTSLE